MDATLSARLAAAQRAARAAGAYLLSRPAFSVTHKQSNDYVTEADRESERMIREELLGEFPQDGFFGEENGASGEGAGRWIVDPIDGTSNCIADLPLYTISIAYEQNGKIVLGCVYCPRLSEMYTAVAGQGAFLNGAPIHVSEQQNLRDALVGMSFAHRNEEAGRRMLALIPTLRESVSDMRRLGSAALDLCFVACGRYEAFVELDLHIYDIAAGMLIVQEAGGVVSAWPGDALSLRESGNTFSCCKSLYAQLYSLVEASEK